MRTAFLLGIALAVLISVTVGNVSAQDALTKLDRQGSVTVAVTLVAPPLPGSPITVRVVLDTHSVGLDGIAFERTVALRKPDGSDKGPAAVEQLSGTGHHREAVVVFRAIEGATDVQIIVRDVGGIPERVFAWEVPVGR
jgi:hypothetical protein